MFTRRILTVFNLMRKDPLKPLKIYEHETQGDT